MSMRQLHVNDPIKITVTDRDGQRQGVMLSRHHQWCWVVWEDHSSPSTEHIDDLWVCDEERALDYLGSFVRAWLPKTEVSVA